MAFLRVGFSMAVAIVVARMAAKMAVGTMAVGRPGSMMCTPMCDVVAGLLPALELGIQT